MENRLSVLHKERSSSWIKIKNVRIKALEVTTNESLLIVQASRHVVEKLQFLIGETIDLLGKFINLNFTLSTQLRHDHSPIAEPLLDIRKLILAEVLVKLSQTVQRSEGEVTVLLVVDNTNAIGKNDSDQSFGQITDHDLFCEVHWQFLQNVVAMDVLHDVFGNMGAVLGPNLADDMEKPNLIFVLVAKSKGNGEVTAEMGNTVEERFTDRSDGANVFSELVS